MFSRWILAVSLLSAPALSAQNLKVTAGQVADALAQEGNLESGVSHLLQETLSQTLREAGIVFEKGQLLGQQLIENVQLSDGCTTKAILDTLSLQARINESTGLAFSYENLTEPLSLSLKLDIDVSGEGDIDQEYGLRLFGDCSYYASDDFSVDVDGALELNLEVQMQLDAQPIEGVGLQIEPVFQVSGSVDQYQFDVSVDDTLLASLIEDELDDGVNDLFSDENVAVMVTDLQDSLNQKVAQARDDGDLFFTVDSSDAGELEALYTTLAQQLSFPLTTDYFSGNVVDLLLAALGIEESQDRLTTLAACDASQLLYADMSYSALYGKTTEGACEKADLRKEESAELYLDEQCSSPVDYQATSITNYCEETLDLGNFGNDAKLAGKSPFWTLYPGTRFEIGLNSIRDNQQPFMTRRVYRSVDTAAGQCELEMRVYKSQIDQTGLKPMMVLHGGSWRHRGAGYPAQESQISHYTNAGFVVFAPFYRLADQSEGNEECQNATAAEILSDSVAALDWVQQHAEEFGVEEGKVVVEGQSAGAYLAASLAVKQSSKVDRALLFYPPTDFVNYLEQYKADPDSFDDAGKNAIEGFMGKTIEELSASDPDVISYSLPQMAQNQVGALPPMFMIHGVADTVVPSTQSVRLCNALSGNAESGNAINDGGSPDDAEYRKLYDCDDRGSELHLIAEGDHALDVCAFNIACPAGDPMSQAETAKSIAASYKWLVDDSVISSSVDSSPTQEGSESSSGGSGGGVFLGAGLFPAVLFRKKFGVVK